VDKKLLTVVEPYSKEPKLRFGKRWNEKLPPLPLFTETAYAASPTDGYDDVSITKVAEALQKYKITRVALNACMSSHAQGDTMSNMTSTLIQHDVSSVSAMSYRLTTDTAGLYYDAFYNSLILNGETFHGAAAMARVALRRPSHSGTEWLLPTTWFSNSNLGPIFKPRAPSGDWVVWCLVMVLVFSCKVSGLPFLLPRTWAYTPATDLLTYSLLKSPLATYSLQTYRLQILCLAAAVVFFFQPRRRILPLLRYGWYAATCAFLRQNLSTRYRERKLRRRRDHDFQTTIEHMILEDHLHHHKGVYVYGSNDVTRSCMRNLARIWICTGFVDQVTIKAATDFHRNWQYYWQCKSFKNPRAEGAGQSASGLRRMVIIEDIPGLLNKTGPDKTVDLSGREVERMHKWIQGQGTTDSPTYVVLTGYRDRDWWYGLTWGSNIRNSWGRADAMQFPSRESQNANKYYT
jgi:hypothetical protein